METTYTYERDTRGRGGSRPRRAARPSGKRRATLAPKECRRLAQLCVCAALFTVVFLGRGIFPDRMSVLRAELLQVIKADTDFRTAFEDLGKSVSDGEPVVATLGELWVDIFSTGEKTTPVAPTAGDRAPVAREEQQFLASNPDAAEVLAHRLGVELPGAKKAAEPIPTPSAAPSAVPSAVPSAAPTPEPTPMVEGTLPAQPTPVYTGPAMPEGATMEDVPLELDRTVSPVMAALSSTYGWREHPIAGGEKFHSGVDLAADYGSPIGAFADGVVDYIGESPAYGQYLQIKHGNGVTSFYAHCSKLCVQPGERVEAGDTVAEVGDTGNVTGTHLHFELKCNGEFLDPLHYIETLS